MVNTTNYISNSKTNTKMITPRTSISIFRSMPMRKSRSNPSLTKTCNRRIHHPQFQP